MFCQTGSRNRNKKFKWRILFKTLCPLQGSVWAETCLPLFSYQAWHQSLSIFRAPWHGSKTTQKLWLDCGDSIYVSYVGYCLILCIIQGNKVNKYVTIFCFLWIFIWCWYVFCAELLPFLRELCRHAHQPCKGQRVLAVPHWFYIKFLNWVLWVTISGTGFTIQSQVSQLANGCPWPLWLWGCNFCAWHQRSHGLWQASHDTGQFCTPSPSNHQSWNSVQKLHWTILYSQSL